MSQTVQSRFVRSRRSALTTRAVVFLILGLLSFAWIGIVVANNYSALVALTRSKKIAKVTLDKFVNALSAGDTATVTSMTGPMLNGKEILDQIPRYQKLGALKTSQYTTINYFEHPDHKMYYIECADTFEHGTVGFEARVSDYGKGWVVDTLGPAWLPRLSTTEPVTDDPDSPNYRPPAPPATSTAPAAPDAPRSLDMTIDVNKHYDAVIDTTRGVITLDLFPREAPITVNNFVVLARRKYFDGLKFFRVEPGFVIQGGDPSNNGTGGPGYSFPDEVDPLQNPHRFHPGTLAMANAGRDTNGSQFFITLGQTPHLQFKHTIFGQVHDSQSMDVVSRIARNDVIKSITIEEAAP